LGEGVSRGRLGGEHIGASWGIALRRTEWKIAGGAWVAGRGAADLPVGNPFTVSHFFNGASRRDMNPLTRSLYGE